MSMDENEDTDFVDEDSDGGSALTEAGLSTAAESLVDASLSDHLSSLSSRSTSISNNRTPIEREDLSTSDVLISSPASTTDLSFSLSSTSDLSSSAALQEPALSDVSNYIDASNSQQSSDNANESIRNFESVSEISNNLNALPSDSSSLLSFSNISSYSNLSNVDLNSLDDEGSASEWLFLPLYEGTDTLNGDVLHQILDIHISSAGTKQIMDKAIQLVVSTLPPGASNFPKTRYFVLKILNELMPHSFCETFIRHRICDICFNYIGKLDLIPQDTSCNVCSNDKLNGLIMQFSITTAIQDAFEVRNLKRFIDEYEQERNSQQLDDVIYDITSGQEFKHLKATVIPEKYDLCLVWNADGIPADNDNGQLWALQAQIVNVHPKYRRRFQILSALYYSNIKSKHKPEMSLFLNPFVQEMKKLNENGVVWKNRDTGETVKSKVIAPVAAMDAPAKAASMNTMQYNGNFGCFTCEHPGQTFQRGKGHKRVFPSDGQEYTLRTKQRILNQARKAIFTGKDHVKGIKGPSITFLIPHFDPSKAFVPDYMHIVLLGVMRMLLFLWFDTSSKDKPFYLNQQTKPEINSLESDIKPEDDVTRTPRSLAVIKYWKASELRAFLLFYGSILLKNKLGKKYYDHFLLLVRAIHILLKSQINIEEVNLADTYLFMFVEDIEDLYGIEKCSYNVHQLLHLSRFVNMWGPLWSWSAFPFEDGNGYLVRMAHGTKDLEVEIANTMHFRNALKFIENLMGLRLENTELNGTPLGAKVEFQITETHLTALRNATGYSENELKNKVKSVYRRIKLKNQKYTSILYAKETKRINYCIHWNNRKNFGNIKYFVKMEEIIYAIVQELLDSSDYDRHLRINSSELDLRFNDIFIPVRNSYCVHALPISQIGGKLVFVNNYVSFLPNVMERK